MKERLFTLPPGKLVVFHLPSPMMNLCSPASLHLIQNYRVHLILNLPKEAIHFRTLDIQPKHQS